MLRQGEVQWDKFTYRYCLWTDNIMTVLKFKFPFYVEKMFVSILI